MRQAKHLVQSQSGMTLIEVMISVAISAIVILASISIGNMTNNIQSQNNFSFQADMIRRNMVSMVLSESAWQNTISHDSGMGCLATGATSLCSPYNTTRTITTLYDGSNQPVFYVNSAGGQGFNTDGTRCTSTSPLCPLTYKVEWTPMCKDAASCLNPQVRVDITATYTPPSGAAAANKSQMVMNEANYSATLYR
jgi:prepilin-type N-terminal cleavage/methylation domain-containing protein